MQFEKEELENLDQKNFLVFKFITKSGKTLAFKRPFPMLRKNLKGADLYNRICDFTMNLSIHDKPVGKER